MLSTDKSWHGRVQRGHLRGFARIRAVLWRRSLRLWEMWSLRSHAWYRPLRKSLQWAFADIDLHSAERCRSESLIYGETPIITVFNLLNLVAELSAESPRLFVDLGAGSGITCLTASCLDYESLGFELEAQWVSRANSVATRLALPARFVCADFLLQPLPSRVILFVVATAYDEAARLKLVENFGRLETGSIIITGDWALPMVRWKLLWSGPLPVDWGTIPFAIYRV